MSTTVISKALTPPIPVPTHGQGGTFSVLVRTIVNAPPETLLNAVRDVSTWPEWNTFCPEGRIISSSSSASPSSTDNDQQPRLGKNDHPGWLETGSTCDLLVYMSGDMNRGGSRHQEVRVTGIWKLEDCEEIAIPEEKLSYEVSSTAVFDSVSGERRKRKGFRIAWMACGWREWQMRSERVMEFEEVLGEDGEVKTLYTCWETFGGVLGVAVKLAVGSALVERFGDYARDLKGFVEGQKRQ
ncbi:hypothetical protein F5884DRAFT_794442 [Xylogone sp. PMI_703]|nr:hypothetical protein F5884DRAFT_794442 [Xylogone sp. PMI_703]